MSCTCETLPDTIYLHEAPRGWLHQLKESATGKRVRLYCCPHCSQHWAIDEQCREEPPVATRITNSQNWHGASDTARKALLTRARGGTTETPCIWAGCNCPTVKQTIYCIDHLYETGARI